MVARGKFGAFSGVFETGVAASALVEWSGDDANDREIDLGVECDLVLIFEKEVASTLAHLCMAYALGDVYGVFIFSTVVDAVVHSSLSAAATYFQGKMAGADATKIKLSGVGTSPYGTNAAGKDYRALGFKLA